MAAELQIFDEAINTSHLQIESLVESSRDKLDKETCEIFEAHISILSDPEIIDNVKELIRCDQVNAAYAVKSVRDNLVTLFEAIEDDYIRERVADIKDVTERIMCNVLGKATSNLSNITEPVILMARDLTPSETAQLNSDVILGFITEIGGKTSHSAIMEE